MQEARETASIVFHVFGMTRSGTEPCLPALVGRAQGTMPLAGVENCIYSTIFNYVLHARKREIYFITRSFLHDLQEKCC